MPLEIELESGEEAKIPTVSEARAIFDQVEGIPQKKVSRAEIQPSVSLEKRFKPKPKEPEPAPVPEFIPEKVVPPEKKPVPPKPAVKPEAVPQEGVKSPSPRLLITFFSRAMY